MYAPEAVQFTTEAVSDSRIACRRKEKLNDNKEGLNALYRRVHCRRRRDEQAYDTAQISSTPR